MATTFPPDPRLNGEMPTYNPDSIIATLTEFYESLSKLPYIEPSDILYPPPSGWPNITESNFAPLNKSPEVIAILKRLPYLRNPTRWGKGYLVSHDTFVIDYSNPPFGKNSEGKMVEGLDEDAVETWSPDYYFGEDEKLPEWVVPLTRSEDNVSGVWLLLDTTDGTITTWDNEPVDDYPSTDPRKWRNNCQRTYLNLKDVLDEWRTEFLSLYAFAFWDKDDVARIWYDRENVHGFWGRKEKEEAKEIQRIMLEYGWPNEFRREECKAALAQWVEDKPEPEAWEAQYG